VIELSAPPALDPRALRRGLQKTYAKIALFPERQHHIHTGRFLAARLGYDEAPSAGSGQGLLEGVPKAALDSFCGAANPWTLGRAEPGETVLDVGCGSGTDLIIAARQVGPDGRAIGVDFSEEMARTAEEAVRKAKLKNVEVRRGEATALPVEDEAVDLVIANGVVNHLIPDKLAAFREIARVLVPGGRLLLGDMSVGIAMPAEVREIVDLWTG
jgi:SAM-dependent methyltransferase